jgi:hypothetical protein
VQALEERRDELGHGRVRASVEGGWSGRYAAGLDGDTCHVERLVVIPDLQERSIGTRLEDDRSGGWCRGQAT